MRALRESGDAGLRVMMLSERSQVLLARPIRGNGGFQRVLRRLQTAAQGDVLVAPIEDINGLVRLSTGRAFRQLGGFQQLAVSLLMDVVRNEEAFPEQPQTRQQRLPFDRSAPRRPRPDWRVIRGSRP